MTNFITGIIGIAMVVSFAGFMLIWVQALPLIIIFLVVFVLLLADFVQSLRGNNNSNARR
jgi:hypothetical protein